MSVSAVTQLAQSPAIYQQIAARHAPARSRAPGVAKDTDRGGDALRAARQAGAGAGSSHSEKTEVRLRAYA